ncbi:MAG: SDR family NAD(P)-dependent oxidoreductase [Roseivirga sp.]|uniref:SDR family NAD(P)-dependent oxidoreductase n=1 Tax=Roseivirga sp. TaxID=1964215 RepID=UPI001B2E513E|nr:SDR family NAD(P)-dependent oxidoreductase [Roseivirga sp.]MBO6660501.1 SDR family NAD(P)-dependent oxidoreductase [Roseivirga sp.]MBO6761955.1 SDR family NAD(P)-dependent oxidoreductase [Roseivirga sp.]MBO6906762.1 SDR family NAD(P)-dependent oxidoreductase [Roseivirga sp.]
MDLSQSNIILTGAGGAFGATLLESLIPDSGHVIGVDLSFEKLPETIRNHAKVDLVKADLTDEVEVQKLVEGLFKKYGVINGLINNAGVIHNEPLVNLLSRDSPIHGLSSWQKVMDINLTAVFLLTAHVVSGMMKKRTKGAIINISSISAYGNAGQSAYAASKAGVIGLTKTWAKELGMWGIRSNAVAPGFFDTKSTHEALNESIIKHIKKETPLKKLGQPEDLYKAIKFTMENEFLNGEVIDLTGGLTL